MKKHGLGKGLSAIFSETAEDYGKNLLFAEREPSGKVQEIPIESVYPNPNQPRKIFDETALKELAGSIKKHGVIMPIIVNKTDDGYMIIAGERRYRASRLANKKTVPVIVKTYNAREIKEISLIENLQREDLNPIESATAMKSLMDDYGLTQEDLADRLGKSRPAIANTLRLLTLSKDVLKLVATGNLSAGHARAMIPLPPDEQLKLAEEVNKSGLSVRDVEERVKAYFAPPPEKEKKKPVELSAELKDFVFRLQRVLGTKVNAIGNDNKGRIYIDYYMREDLDRIADLLDVLEKQKK